MVGLGKLFPKEEIVVGVYECERGTMFGWTAAVSRTGPILNSIAESTEQAIADTISKMIWCKEALQYRVGVERVDFATRVDLRMILWNDDEYPAERLSKDREAIYAACHALAVRLYDSLRGQARTRVQKRDMLQAELGFELQAFLAATAPGSLQETAERMKAVAEEWRKLYENE
jgi:hypothetical protein